jgi:hypothetical protein
MDKIKTFDRIINDIKKEDDMLWFIIQIKKGDIFKWMRMIF